MPALPRFARRTVLILAAALLTACGSGTTDPVPPPPPPAPPPPPPPPPAPPGVVVLDHASLGQSGGELRVTQATAALRGLSISVPTGAYPTSTTWTVTELPAVRPTLPAGVRQIGPAIQIENGQGYSEAPFTISVPARVPADTSIGLFYYEASTGTFEMVPVLQRTDTSLVVLTRHLSSNQLLIPDGAAAPQASASVVGHAGLAQLLLLATARSNLRGNFDSGFRPGVDDWEFSNRGDYLNPGGYCAGASLTAIYHYYMRKASRGSLFGLYDDLNPVEPDNPRGIRIASIVQEIAGRPSIDIEVQQLLQVLNRIGASASGSAWVRVQTDAMALAIRMTGSPQLLAIFQPGMTRGHAIVAHRIESDGAIGSIFVADPNDPGVARDIFFNNLGFLPFASAPMAGVPAEGYTIMFVVGVTALMAMPSMSANWSAVEAKTIGKTLYPATTLQYLDPVDTLWRDVGPVVPTASPDLAFRTMCPSCPVGRTAAAKYITRQMTVIYKTDGNIVGHDLPDLLDGAPLSVSMGDTKVGLEENGWVPASQTRVADWEYMNFTWVTVKRVPFEVTMAPANPQPGQDVTYTVENGGVGDGTSRYRWTIGADPPVITPFSTRQLKVPAPQAASYVVRVELIDPTDHRLADAKLYVGGAPFWRITTFLDQDDLLEKDEGSPLGTLLKRIMAAPQSGLIAIDDEGGGRNVLRLRVLQGGLWSLSNCCPPVGAVLPGEIQTTLGIMPQQVHTVGGVFLGWNIDRWAQTSLDLGTGTLTGQYVDGITTYPLEDGGTVVGPRGVLRITGNRTGTTMTGVITITGWFTITDADDKSYLDPDPATFRMAFTAVRLR